MVASIAVQVALAGALVGLIRWLRLQSDPVFSPSRARLVVPGCQLVVAAIGVTLLTNLAAMTRMPLSPNPVVETTLSGGLSIIGMMGSAAILTTRAARQKLAVIQRGEERPPTHTLAELIEDGLVAAGRAGGWAGQRFPVARGLIGWTLRTANRAWEWVDGSPVSPRSHPWRFVTSYALAYGVTWFALEGLPPDLGAGGIAAALLFGVELAAVLGGYLAFGGWLGIRPPMRHTK